MSAHQRRKLYSVWCNDEFDTLIALDLPADQCAELMGVKIGVFYQLACRQNDKWVIIKTGREKKHE